MNDFPSFGQRAEIFFGARASGRTWRLLQAAPKNATILARNEYHWRNLVETRNKMGRTDLRVKVLTTPPVGDPPFWPDHETITDLFYQADMRIAELVRMNNKLAARIKEVEKENEERGQHIYDCESWIKWVDEQPEGEILRLRASGAENQEFDTETE